MQEFLSSSFAICLWGGERPARKCPGPLGARGRLSPDSHAAEMNLPAAVDRHVPIPHRWRSIEWMRQDQTIDRSGPSLSRVRVKLVATLLLLPLLHHWAGMASTELPGGCPGFQCLQQPVHNRGTEKTQTQQRSILCLASASRQTCTFMMVHISHHSSSRTAVRKTTVPKDESGPSQLSWHSKIMGASAPAQATNFIVGKYSTAVEGGNVPCSSTAIYINKIQCAADPGPEGASTYPACCACRK